MKLNVRKYISISLLAVCLTLIIVLSFFAGEGKSPEITAVKLNGAVYIDSLSYLKYASLDEPEQLAGLSAFIIKDRIEKHPYVYKCDLKPEGKGILKADITEKKFLANINSGNVNYLLSENFQLIPIYPYTRNIDLPVITEPYSAKPLKVFGYVSENKSILNAVKMLHAAKLVEAGPDFYDSISEIDYSGGGLEVYFNEYDFPFQLGKGNGMKKMIYLYEILNKIQLSDSVKYVDLRFNKYCYIGR